MLSSTIELTSVTCVREPRTMSVFVTAPWPYLSSTHFLIFSETHILTNTTFIYTRDSQCPMEILKEFLWYFSVFPD